MIINNLNTKIPTMANMCQLFLNQVGLLKRPSIKADRWLCPTILYFYYKWLYIIYQVGRAGKGVYRPNIFRKVIKVVKMLASWAEFHVKPVNIKVFKWPTLIKNLILPNLVKKITYKSITINLIYGKIEFENKEIVVFRTNEDNVLVIKKKNIIKIEKV